MKKQGQTIGGILAGNMILNFEKGILVEWGYTSASGEVPPQPVNPDLWEGDVSITSGTNLSDSYITGTCYGLNIPLAINAGDTITFTMGGTWGFTAIRADLNYYYKYVFDGRYRNYDTSYSGDIPYPVLTSDTSYLQRTYQFFGINDGGSFLKTNHSSVTIISSDFSTHSYQYSVRVNSFASTPVSLTPTLFIPMYEVATDGTAYQTINIYETSPYPITNPFASPFGTIHIKVEMTRA